jgi:hypothetical protein
LFVNVAAKILLGDSPIKSNEIYRTESAKVFPLPAEAE